MSRFIITTKIFSRKFQTSTLHTSQVTKRQLLQYVVTALILVSDPALANGNGSHLLSAIRYAPLYESREDPPGQQTRRILAEGNVLHFGQAGEQRKSLLGSDLGFPIYFVRVNGGVRVREQPIVFPDASYNRFEFDDYNCTVVRSVSRQDVVCRSNLNGQLYHSRIVSGGLVSFDLRCFDRIKSVCHYELIGGHALRPTKVQNL